MKLQLIHSLTKKPAVVGDVVKTFRGEKAVLKGWSEPYDAELVKQGDCLVGLNLTRGAKIYCQRPNSDFQDQWYPTVCDLEFVLVP